jgi:hypothetical protein
MRLEHASRTISTDGLCLIELTWSFLETDKIFWAYQKTHNLFGYNLTGKRALQPLHSSCCISVELLLIRYGHADERRSFPKMDKNSSTPAIMDKSNSGMCVTPILLIIAGFTLLVNVDIVMQDQDQTVNSELPVGMGFHRSPEPNSPRRQGAVKVSFILLSLN